MPTSRKVSLTTFVDFVSKSGTPKITVVRRFKRGDPYRPAFDFYKPVREAIVAVHKRGEPRKALDALVEGARDPRKIEPLRRSWRACEEEGSPGGATQRRRRGRRRAVERLTRPGLVTTI